MFGNIFGTRASHYNPDELRDWHGRWTTGGSSWRNNPLRDPSPVGRARTFLGHGLAGAFQQGVIRDVAYPTQAEGERFSRLLALWRMAAGIDDETFREHFARSLNIDPKTLHRLRQAAAGAAEAQTIGQMIEASYPLTAAIKVIGADRWPGVLKGLEDRADAARASNATTLTPVSWMGQIGESLLSTLNPFGTANAQTRGAPPRLTPEEELRMDEYRELQNEFGKNGLSYQVVTNPGWVPTRRDLDDMRSELNRQLAQRNTPTPSLDELLHPQRSCSALVFENKIVRQMQKRGWTEDDVRRLTLGPPAGTSRDGRYTKGGTRRDDPATVYGKPGNYVVVNDRTGEVVQVSNRNDKAWVDDDQIKWNRSKP